MRARVPARNERGIVRRSRLLAPRIAPVLVTVAPRDGDASVVKGFLKHATATEARPALRHRCIDGGPLIGLV